MSRFNRARLKDRSVALILAYLAGASTALSFAPYQIWPIYILALSYVLHFSQKLSAKESAIYWLSFGFGCFSVGISWVHVSIDTFGGMPLVVSVALMALLALYLALYPAIAGYLLSKFTVNALQRNLLIFPALWVLTEWFRGWVLTGFPWLWAGYSQTQGPLSSLASSIGALGLSYIIAIIAGALALCYKKKVSNQKKITLIVSISLSISGVTLLNQEFKPVTETGELVSVTLVQGNIPQSMKWNPDSLWPTMLKYLDLSRPKMQQSDIIIWPEAAIPAPESMVADFLDTAHNAAQYNDSTIITGIIRHQDQQFYNSLIVLGEKEIEDKTKAPYRSDTNNRFDKHHLLPIGEFVPLESILRPLAPFFNLPMSSFSRGDFIQKNLSAKGTLIAPAICYEIAFPEQVRANVTPDTNLLLTVSNDAWFGDSNGPLQHMEIAQMRAIELGRPLLRSTNNGVTGIINPQGEITHQLPQFETGVLVASVPLVTGTTLFSQLGQWPVLIFSWMTLLIFIICSRKRL